MKLICLITIAQSIRYDRLPKTSFILMPALSILLFLHHDFLMLYQMIILHVCFLLFSLLFSSILMPLSKPSIPIFNSGQPWPRLILLLLHQCLASFPLMLIHVFGHLNGPLEDLFTHHV